MELNWLDIVLLGILLFTLILGIVKGLVKQIIGILAVFLGLILALLYYPVVSGVFMRLISSKVVSQFLGFLAIFLAVLCLGALLSAMLSKLMKGPLKFLNHALGGCFGLLKGILICGVLLFAMLVFPVNKKVVQDSQVAPVCLVVTKGVFSLIPKDLREKFNRAYADIVGRRDKNARRI